MTSLVDIAGVVKRFNDDGAPALGGIDATIEAGQITGLVGPDGAGKTTLIRLMTGLMTPTEGRIEVLGLDTARDAARIQAGVGYMPQRFGLYEDLTVQENLNLYANLRGLPAGEHAETFARLLDFTGLADFTARLAGRLSGGMKQKLGLACAMIRAPRLMLLDEPSVGVDPISRRELWGMVRELAGREVGVVWSTAYLDEAEKCDSVILLNEGSLIFHGPPNDLTERIAGRVWRVSGVAGHRRTLLPKVLECEGVIDGVVQGRSLRVILGPGAHEDAIRRGLQDEGESAEFEAIEPRFEDAFIDALGRRAPARSALAEHRTPIPADGGMVIEAQGLTKKFGTFTAAADMTFSIPKGEIFGLLGPNGAGKSTTFKMLCGLLPPSAGEGRVAGFDLRRARADARNRLGYMAQKFSLYGDLSVRQNLEFFSGVYGLGGARQRQQIEAMIETFDLSGQLRRNARDLPLGYKQRLALACAVMHEPEALFLDEPTSGVDPLTRREFWTHINGLVEKGVAILVTTHFMDEAEYCDRIALIFRGHTIATGSPDELKERSVTPALPDPTLEDAFIAMVEASETAREEAA